MNDITIFFFPLFLLFLALREDIKTKTFDRKYADILSGYVIATLLLVFKPTFFQLAIVILFMFAFSITFSYFLKLAEGDVIFLSNLIMMLFPYNLKMLSIFIVFLLYFSLVLNIYMRKKNEKEFPFLIVIFISLLMAVVKFARV
jgi:hypothetical protein